MTEFRAALEFQEGALYTEASSRTVSRGAGRAWGSLLNTFLAVLLTLSATVSARPTSASAEPELTLLLLEAHRLQESSQDKEALDVYLSVLARSPDHLQALCAASYLYGLVGKRNEKVKADFFNRSLRLAKRAHQLAPDDPETNFALAWAYGGLAMISPAREKVDLAKKIKPLIDLTLRSNPRDDRAWYVLANWRYRIADASLLERAAARIINGGLPESATYESSIDAYQKAVSLRPDSILYRYELARTLFKIDRGDDALPQIEHALTIPIRTPDDPTLLAKCRALLRRILK